MTAISIGWIEGERVYIFNDKMGMHARKHFLHTDHLGKRKEQALVFEGLA